MQSFMKLKLGKEGKHQFHSFRQGQREKDACGSATQGDLLATVLETAPLDG